MKLSKYTKKINKQLTELREYNLIRPEKKFVSKQVVIDYVNNLHPAKLMYSINHIYNKHKLEEKVAEALSI